MVVKLRNKTTFDTVTLAETTDYVVKDTNGVEGSSETKVKATEYLSICEDYAIQERAKMGLSIDASVVEKS
jgi:hypothetical protein